MANFDNRASNTLIAGTSDNDSIYNYYSNYVTITADAGNDTIYSYSTGGLDGNRFFGGDGDDSIRSIRGNNALIHGDAGDDTISNENARGCW